MRKQTDLAKVKQTALALLSTEINETPYSPMIVKHPFSGKINIHLHIAMTA